MGDYFLWASETIAEGLLEYYALKGVVASAATKHQEVKVVDTVPYGRCLVIDGKIQSSVLDERVYHESLVHSAMVTVSDPKKVLVIGGGEGATAREVLRWRTVEEVEMVEIDGEVVDFCRLHMSELSSGVFEDQRFRLILSEGREYLRSKVDGTYDVIVIDATDPTEGAASIPLYTSEFYRMAYDKLTKKGALVTQATSIAHNPFAFRSILETVRTAFPSVTPLAAYVLSFASLWGFVVGSKSRDCGSLSAEEVDSVLKERVRGPLTFYSGETHRAMIQFAKLYSEVHRSDYRIIRDGSPVLIP
ncbi:MAG: fused MFS/spermidine synthase [Thaumarchaeota archaeon]|nr:fused MFS/spermidine synthase [Candidatus Calditenuaceae archaeon]MDW8187468.1 fused MFS/spermidine synthase [Nitrososphaerota archaeon]